MLPRKGRAKAENQIQPQGGPTCSHSGFSLGKTTWSWKVRTIYPGPSTSLCRHQPAVEKKARFTSFFKKQASDRQTDKQTHWQAGRIGAPHPALTWSASFSSGSLPHPHICLQPLADLPKMQRKGETDRDRRRQTETDGRRGNLQISKRIRQAV